MLKYLEHPQVALVEISLSLDLISASQHYLL
jgi:hypothetical protein